MKNYLKNQRGVSALELITVISITLILIIIVFSKFSSVREGQVIKSAVEGVLSSIDRARGETLSSLNSSEYGVHFQSDKVIIFKGKVFSAGDSLNESIDLTTPASITNVTFGGVSGTSGDVYFNRLSGMPSTTGTISINTGSYSKIITISATGSASVN
jgi:Tfp pilus assembly protein FimT